MTVPANTPAQHNPNLARLVGHHDLALPGAGDLLHGAVLRPPNIHWNGHAYCGPALQHIQVDAARHVPGVVDIVIRHNFVAVIASQPNQAAHARAQIQAQWRDPEPQRVAQLTNTGQASAAPQPASPGITRSYTWVNTTDDAPAWAIARHTSTGLTLWANTSRATQLRTEIASLCGLPAEQVTLVTNDHPGEGYDAAVDAALLAFGRSKPVRVQHDTTTGPATITLELQADRTPASQYTERANMANALRPSVAALLCGVEHRYASAMAQPDTLYGVPVSQQPAATAYALGPANDNTIAAGVFARESFFDELCALQSQDPVKARLETITDPTGKALVESVAQQAGWFDPPQPGAGKGFACAQIIDNAQDPPQAIWSAWVAEVAINDGAIDITRLTVGHTANALASASDATKIEHHVRDTARGLLGAPDTFDQWADANTYTTGTLTLPEVSVVPQQSAVGTPLVWHPNAQLPAAAAIANAIYKATGTRIRQAPFNTGNLLPQGDATEGKRSKRWAYGLLGGIAASAAGLVLTALPLRGAIAPVAVDTTIYSAAAIERGRLVALAGDCMVCHTAEGGIENTGGRPLETPFGTVYTTNITPDSQTGIGNWSYAAFERAMREGIHRDGRHLYPVFPYTAFAKITDADMQSLYAYLMTREPVSATPPKTELAFPYNARPLMAGWNTLFHKNEVYQPDPTQSTLWNRGAYLVQGAGHCAACHSPRNSMGAEKSGAQNFLAGGFADGWEAPALNALSKAPIAWTEDTLFEYLRNGYSSVHGVASGPMGPVVQNLAQLPESDVRAMAHYLAAINPPPASAEPAALTAAKLEEASRSNVGVMTMPGEALFEGACAVCHDAREGPPLFGARPSLALNTNIHSDHPDNVIQVLMHGIDDPTGQGLGYMPGFKDSLNDKQIREMIEYMRARFAPGKPQWQGLDEKISSIRTMHGP